MNHKHIRDRAKQSDRRTDLTDSRRETLYGELNALLGAGVDFSNAFALLIEAEEHGAVKAMLERLYARIVEGCSLRRAMSESGAFPTLDCGVVDIGEQTGRLAEALEFLAEYYRKRAALRRMVSSAVSYPIVVLCMAMVVTAFMLTVVVPMFEQVYARMGGELPTLTRRIIAVAEAFPEYAAVTAATVVAAALLYRHHGKDERVQRITCTIMLRLPVIGGIIRKNNEVRICKLLDLLCSSGIPLLAGVTMISEATKFYLYRRSLAEMARMLEQGTSFADAMAQYPELYERRLVALVRVGEQTNRLRQMLRKLGDTLTDELEHAIRRMGTIAEPLLILLVGSLVAIILISMYLPMFRLESIM